MSDPTDPAATCEHGKHADEKLREDALRAHDSVGDHKRSANEAAINNANIALRSALLMNGGAAVALLSFLTNLPEAPRKTAAGTLLWFAWGVVSAVGAIVLSYFTNYCMAAYSASRQKFWERPFLRDGPNTWRWLVANRIFHALAIVATIASLAFFIIGMLEIRAALISPASRNVEQSTAIMDS